MSGPGAFDVGYGAHILKVHQATKKADLALNALKNRGKLNEALTKTIGAKPSSAHTATYLHRDGLSSVRSIIHKRRRLIETFFRKLTEYRGMAMRSCKAGTSFAASIAIAATIIGLR